MLERVTPSAECAAQIFLHRFEAPVRSYRSLGPLFWKHGSENINVPAWWPAYLDKIRSKSSAPSGNSRLNVTNNKPLIVPRQRNATPGQANTRTFTRLTPCAQSATVQAAPEDELDIVEDGGNTLVNNEKELTHRPATTMNGTSGSFHEVSSVSPNVITRLERAWLTFVKSGSNRTQASSLLHMLAKGNSNDLDHALRAFDLIPKGQRSSQDYTVAVNVSVTLGRYSATIPIIREAVSRNINQETFFQFLSICISKDLWNTAADLWQEIGENEGAKLQLATIDPGSKKQNFAGRYISCFNTIADLPSKIVSITARLQDNDPTLAAKRKQLTSLCQNLALVAVESETVMSMITGEGLMAMFSVQEQLELKTNLHFTAIATINLMHEKGTKCQLAMLAYNNFKFKNSDAFVPKWVFKSVLAIASAGRQHPDTYRTVLQQYKTCYGIPEHSIYFQVMQSCANQGEFEHVQAVFNDFHQHHRLRGADDLNPLIRAYAVLGNSEKAQLQFDRLQSSFGFQPSTKNWNTLLLAYSRSARPKTVFDKFRDMQSNGVRPDKYTWSIMTAAAAKRGDTKHARNLVRQAMAAGISPPLPMIGAVVDSYLLNNQPEDASALVNEATSAFNWSIESPVRLWNSLFRYYAFRSDSEAIIRTQEKMKELGVAADSMTYAALMTALVIQGRTQDAVKILRTLHFSQKLSANEFHYSILIHGFAMEQKHDLASALHHEMLERFGRSTPSARLSMLHLQATRAEIQARNAYLSGKSHLKPDLQSTMRSIQDNLADVQASDLASPFPNPGFRRRVSRNDLQSVYLGSLVQFLNRNGAHSSSQKILQILDQNKGLLQSQVFNETSWISQIEQLSQEMDSLIRTGKWLAVDTAWKQIVDIALQNCTSLGAKQRSQSSRSLQSNRSHNIDLIKEGEETHFSNMIFQPFSTPMPSRDDTKVLAAHQYVLSRALSQYLKALSEQQKFVEMIQTTDTLRGYGFTLSGKNWNGLIQALCRSNNTDHQAQAYELFESFLLPFAPSWDTIRRGMWVAPSEERPRSHWDKRLQKKDNRQSRKVLEKLNPGLRTPSYYTMVHLAIVWLKASRSSAEGDSSMRHQLENRAPGTVKLTLKTPYLRDRAQGVLLRGRRVIGDHEKRPRQPRQSTHYAGVLGSQSLIDHISPETMQVLEKLSGDQLAGNHEFLETLNVTRPVDKTRVFLPSKGRLESWVERYRRILRAKRHNIDLLKEVAQQLRERSEHPDSLVGTIARGHTSFNLRRDSPHNEITSVDHVKSEGSSISDAMVGNADISATSSEFAQQRMKILGKLNRILRRVSTTSMYKPSALAARNQKYRIRTSSLTQRQGLQLHFHSCAGTRLYASPRRIPRRLQTLRFQRATDDVGGNDQSQGPRYIFGKSLEDDGSMPQARRSHIYRLHRQAQFHLSVYERKRSQVLTRPIPSRIAKRQLNQYKKKAQKAFERVLAYKFETGHITATRMNSEAET